MLVKNTIQICLGLSSYLTFFPPSAFLVGMVAAKKSGLKRLLQINSKTGPFPAAHGVSLFWHGAQIGGCQQIYNFAARRRSFISI